MINEIKTIDDVSTFVKQLVAESLNFHPDEDFENYINVETGKPSYTSEQADKRNIVNKQCFEVCEKFGVDIYNITQEVFLIETGLSKYIPLPSQEVF